MTVRTWKPDGPGSFLAPAGVTAVQDSRGWVWSRNPRLGTRWTRDGKNWIRWRILVDEHGPVTEIPRKA